MSVSFELVRYTAIILYYVAGLVYLINTLYTLTHVYEVDAKFHHAVRRENSAGFLLSYVFESPDGIRSVAVVDNSGCVPVAGEHTILKLRCPMRSKSRWILWNEDRTRIMCGVGFVIFMMGIAIIL